MIPALAQIAEPAAAPPDAAWLAPWLASAGFAILAMLLMRRSYRYFGKKKRRGGSGPHIDAQPRPADQWSGAKNDAHARIDRAQVELHQLARDLQGKLDSKIIVLNELIAQSQQKIERLEALLDEVEERQPQMHADERG